MSAVTLLQGQLKKARKARDNYHTQYLDAHTQAVRYQWLRRKLIQGITVHYDESLGRELIDILSSTSGGSFDAAVDRAIAAESEPMHAATAGSPDAS
jgi:hypothetical protein